MLFQKDKKLVAAATGMAVPLDQVPDEAFSTGILGEGIAIDPFEGTVYAPADGTVESITDSLHAYTILTPDGLDILIHIGIDTVNLKGEGFLSMVKVGDRVKAGDVLARVDLNLLRGKNFPTLIPVLVVNAEDLQSKKPKFGTVKGGIDTVLQYQIKKKTER